MGDPTPAQKLAGIRKTIATAKDEERKAIWDLPKDDRHRDWQMRQDRILRGSTEVTVDYELSKDDLSDLGYHHEDDCGSASYDDTDVPDHESNRRRLADWHDETHGLSLWANCRQEPCRILTDEFRSSR